MVIGRGRRREHPNQHCLLLLRVLHNFRLRMRTPKGTPKGIKWPSVTSGSHVTTTKKKKTRGKNGACAEHTSGHDRFRSRDFVTSGQKATLGRILRNFRLCMRRTYFRTGHVTDVTSGHVTNGTSGRVTSGHAQWSDPPQIWLELYQYTTGNI